MGQFYQPASYRSIVKLLKKLGFEITPSKKHLKATDPKSGRATTVPRHATLANGTVESICDFLVDCGYDKGVILKSLK